MKFYKYHALGNDYIVMNPSEMKRSLTPGEIRRICHRHYGIGSDGILLGPLEASGCDFGLKIFNPDGTEAEKSGNGLRIFSLFLWDRGMVHLEPFTILTPGGEVTSQVLNADGLISVGMGKITFNSKKIPVQGPRREVLNETLTVEGEVLEFCAASIGNPHCVILRDHISAEETQRLGPMIETHARFPNRTNVQFVKVLDRSTIQIEIWERGAGYTLASGSSSCAAAAVAHRLGLCGPEIAVHMPGGRLDIKISDAYGISMTGPVTRVAEGCIFGDIFTSP
jgi:diaminopimelate epimerase